MFDDDVDIFADLAVKSKEKSTRKKMEAVSIFDEDTGKKIVIFVQRSAIH